MCQFLNNSYLYSATPDFSGNCGKLQALTWRGEGSISSEEQQKLKQFVSTAHAKGQRIRFYAAPDNVSMWRELLAADVDLINTDDLDRLQQFLLQEDPLVKGSPTK